MQALTEAKNHALVLKDCVLERTVRGIINSTYGCAGQRCMALPVVCVQESIADKFVALLTKFAQELRDRAGLSAESQLGPVVLGRPEGVRSRKRSRAGVEEGAKLVLDGRRVKCPATRAAITSARRFSITSSPASSSATRKSSGR